jgi:hypothetical protein
MTDFHAREREELHELQARVVLTMPQRGWSRESYERELALHAERHGRGADGDDAPRYRRDIGNNCERRASSGSRGNTTDNVS